MAESFDETKIEKWLKYANEEFAIGRSEFEKRRIMQLVTELELEMSAKDIAEAKRRLQKDWNVTED